MLLKLTWRLMLLSIHVPKFLTPWTSDTLASPTASESMWTLGSCWRMPIIAKSVLPSLIISLSHCTKALISFTHRSMEAIYIFSLYVLFSDFRPRDAPHGNFPFVFFISYAYICTCIRRHFNETIPSSSIPWSEMGKQNIHAKVYCIIGTWGTARIKR